MYYEHITDLVGNTPVVKLGKYFPGYNIFTKLEYFNPTFSIKDRVAQNIVKEKLKSGEVIANESTLIVPTSGNAGLGLIAIAKRYNVKVVCVITNNVGNDKKWILEKYGAKIIICDDSTPSESPGGYIYTAKDLLNTIPNSVLIDQFSNDLNPKTHFTDTSREMWDQMDGKIDKFYACAGTGGTISGISQFLKTHNPNIEVVGVDVVGSTYFDRFYGNKSTYYHHSIESIGDDIMPKNLNFTFIDRFEQYKDSVVSDVIFKLLAEESIFIGTSSALVLHAISEDIKKGLIKKKEGVIFLITDFGYKYFQELQEI
jgi:cystathionine beta-synthase